MIPKVIFFTLLAFHPRVVGNAGTGWVIKEMLKCDVNAGSSFASQLTQSNGRVALPFPPAHNRLVGLPTERWLSKMATVRDVEADRWI